MKQSRLQAFFIWSFSLEISSFPGWKSHQTTETKSSLLPPPKKKTRKQKNKKKQNKNWKFRFKLELDFFFFLIPHLPSVASHLIRQRMEGTAQTCQRHPGEPPSIQQPSQPAIHSSCIELYNSSSTRVSLETTVAPAPAGFFSFSFRVEREGNYKKNTEASRG